MLSQLELGLVNLTRRGSNLMDVRCVRSPVVSLDAVPERSAIFSPTVKKVLYPELEAAEGPVLPVLPVLP